MKTSELIEHLQQSLKDNGDLIVYYWGYDEGRPVEKICVVESPAPYAPKIVLELQ